MHFYFLPLILITLSVAAFSENFDLLIIRPSKSSDFIKSEAIRVINDPNLIASIYDIASESVSEGAGCSFHYFFDFYRNNELAKAVPINTQCESKQILKKLKKYFPKKKDQYRMYYLPVECSANVDSMRNILQKAEYLLYSSASIERFPLTILYVSGNIVCGKKYQEECGPDLDKLEKLWILRFAHLHERISELKPVKVESKTGQVLYLAKNRKINYTLKVWTRTPMRTQFDAIADKFCDIIDSTKVIRHDTFQLTLISRNAPINKIINKMEIEYCNKD